MTAFDPILRDMGLVPKVYDHDSRSFIDPEKSYRTLYSTMGHLDVSWLDQSGQVVAIIGISDGYTPVVSLVHPRPRILVSEEILPDGRKLCHVKYTTTPIVERMIQKVGHAEVLRMGLAGEPWKDPSILDG